MDDQNIWQELLGRPAGPFKLRLILQPAMAIFFAIRAGRRDGKENRPPYGWALLTDRAHRRELLREGWKDVGKIFVIASVIDVIYQFVVFRTIHPAQALVVASVLAVVPYLLIRGPAGRISRRAR